MPRPDSHEGMLLATFSGIPYNPQSFEPVDTLGSCVPCSFKLYRNLLRRLEADDTKVDFAGAGLLLIVAGTGRLLAAPQDAQQKPAYTWPNQCVQGAMLSRTSAKNQTAPMISQAVSASPCCIINYALLLTNYALKIRGTLEYADRQIALGQD